MHAFFDSIPPAREGSPTCAPLAGFRVITAAGSDALAFLHGQVTQDITGLKPEAAALAGYCTAKGRLLATMVAWRATQTDDPEGPQLHALVRDDLADALIKRLGMFVLRAKAKLSSADLQAGGVTAAPAQVEALAAAAGGDLPHVPWQRAELPSGTWIGAPSADTQRRWWWIATAAQFDSHGAALAALLGRTDEDSWRAADLAAGLPWIAQATQDVFIPQTVNLDLIGGVNFRKGCYPGQEVVARSHYRGTVKRRMAYGTLADGGPVAAGTDVYDATQPNEPCGRVVDAAALGRHVAVLFETTLASLPAGALHLGAPDGPAITVAALPYPIEPDAS